MYKKFFTLQVNTLLQSHLMVSDDETEDVIVLGIGSHLAGFTQHRAGTLNCLV